MPGGNKVGIRTSSIITTAQAVTSSTTLVNATQLVFSVLAGTTWFLRFNIPFSTGAAGGAKFQIIAPAAPTQFMASWQLYLNGSPGTLADAAVQTTSASFANALASAGNSLMTACAWIVASAAGTVGLQFAQNSSNGTPVTLLVGGTMEVTQF